MKTTIELSWTDDGKENHVVVDNWDEMIHFLCVNKKVDLKVKVFEQGCMTCYMADVCAVWEAME